MSMRETAAKIVAEAGEAGGIDEVRRIATRGWPAREGQSVELCEAVQAFAVIADLVVWTSEQPGESRPWRVIVAEIVERYEAAKEVMA